MTVDELREAIDGVPGWVPVELLVEDRPWPIAEVRVANLGRGRGVLVAASLEDANGMALWRG